MQKLLIKLNSTKYFNGLFYKKYRSSKYEIKHSCKKKKKKKKKTKKNKLNKILKKKHNKKKKKKKKKKAKTTN